MPSMSSFGDYFSSKPPTIAVQLESQPPGADATTSIGPGCKTPCSVQVTPPEGGFSVTFALPRYQPASVQVSVIRNPGDFSTPATTVTDPNPVFAELRPAGPPPKMHKTAKPHRVKKPKGAAGAAPAGGSPFPDPNAKQ
jgi:hypothetical protein